MSYDTGCFADKPIFLSVVFIFTGSVNLSVKDIRIDMQLAHFPLVVRLGTLCERENHLDGCRIGPYNTTNKSIILDILV
jgi:hypothetical protein